MIIKIKDADFSANNLGAITVPVSLSVFTKEAIKASGNTDMTSEQSSALELFFSSIGATSNSGIFTKINKMYIPFIGKDVTYGLVNYKSNIKEASLSSEHLTLINGGVKAKSENVSIDNGGNVVNDFVWDWSNFCIMMMNTEPLDLTGNVTSSQLSSYVNNISNKWSGFRLSVDTAKNIQFKADQNNSNLIPNNTAFVSGYTDNKPHLFGLSGNGSKFIGLVGGGLTKEFAFDTSVATSDASHILYPFSSGISGSISASLKACGVWIAGEAMTSHEMIQLQSAVEALYSAFGE